MLQQKLISMLLNALVYEDHDEHDETFGDAVGEFLLQCFWGNFHDPMHTIRG